MIKKITILAMLFMFVGAVSAQDKTTTKKECAKTEKCAKKCNKDGKCTKECDKKCDKQCKNKSAKAEKGNCSKACEKSSTAKK